MTARAPFRFATALMCAATAVSSLPRSTEAQHDSGAMLKRQYLEDVTTLETKFLDLAGAMEAEMFSWRPMEGVRSVSEVFMLIAAENYVVPSAWEAAPPAGMTISNALFRSLPADVTAKEDVLDQLGRSFTYYKQTLEALPTDRLDASITFFGRQRSIHEALFVITMDMHEHLGQAIAYARTNEVVPPWTARAQQQQSGN